MNHQVKKFKVSAAVIFLSLISAAILIYSFPPEGVVIETTVILLFSLGSIYILRIITTTRNSLVLSLTMVGLLLLNRFGLADILTSILFLLIAVVSLLI
jgi:hypothetical protein